MCVMSLYASDINISRSRLLCDAERVLFATAKLVVNSSLLIIIAFINSFHADFSVFCQLHAV